MGKLDGGARDGVRARAEAFDAAPSWPITKKSKGDTKTVDLRTRVRRLTLDGDRLLVELSTGGFMDLLEILAPGPERERMGLARTSLEAPPDLLPQPEKRSQKMLDTFEASGGFRQ